MKKMILSAVMLAIAACGFAQERETEAAAEPGMRSEWLPSFASVVVAAPLDIRFIRVPDTQAPKIEYDTKGSYTTKFKAEVKNKVLRITEKYDSRRTARTQVTVYYNDLQSVSVTAASATFEGTLSATLFDLTLGDRASLTASLDIKDLRMELSGHSSATLSGSVRYLTLMLSTGSLSAEQLETMSAQVNVTGSGSADLWVTDRLDAKTSTGGKIAYRGNPTIVRGGSKFMGGDIKRVIE